MTLTEQIPAVPQTFSKNTAHQRSLVKYAQFYLLKRLGQKH